MRKLKESIFSLNLIKYNSEEFNHGEYYNSVHQLFESLVDAVKSVTLITDNEVMSYCEPQLPGYMESLDGTTVTWTTFDETGKKQFYIFRGFENGIWNLFRIFYQRAYVNKRISKDIEDLFTVIHSGILVFSQRFELPQVTIQHSDYLMNLHMNVLPAIESLCKSVGLDYSIMYNLAMGKPLNETASKFMEGYLLDLIVKYDPADYAETSSRKRKIYQTTTATQEWCPISNDNVEYFKKTLDEEMKLASDFLTAQLWDTGDDSLDGTNTMFIGGIKLIADPDYPEDRPPMLVDSKDLERLNLKYKHGKRVYILKTPQTTNLSHLNRAIEWTELGKKETLEFLSTPPNTQSIWVDILNDKTIWKRGLDEFLNVSPDAVRFEEYQRGVTDTTNPDLEQKEAVANAVFGFVGELSEVVEPLKKYYYHGHELDLNSLKKELGDTLFYMAWLCNIFGFNMGEIAQLNRTKLKARYPNGFSKQASQERSS